MTGDMVLRVRTHAGEQTFRLAPDAAGRTVADVLRRAGVPLNTRCGERGLCQGCDVALIAGHLSSDAGPLQDWADATRHLLQGCLHRLVAGTDVTIEIPARSLLTHAPQVVTSFRLDVPWASQPVWQRTAADCAWSYRGEDWTRDALVAVPALGAAIDVGTTTVAVVIANIETGEVLGQASALNAQARLGDNVLTRINLCMTGAEHVGHLQRLLVEETLAPLLAEALASAGQGAGHLAAIAVAGNTTMLHLLAGVDPGPIGVAPFDAAFLEYRRLSASDIGLSAVSLPSMVGALRADLPLHLLPGAAAYVGADVVAGTLTTGVAYRQAPCLLLDLGTNGEIVLQHEGRLWGCSTAAGPAFEGAGLVCGVRAGDGAVSHLWFDEDPRRMRTEVIGHGRPLGLCGTAYLDFVARGRRAGVLSPTGRILVDPGRHDTWRDPFHGRVILVAEGAGRRPLFVSEADVATILQAKAAIAAGITCLLRKAGLSAGDVAVLVAGGFGFHMHPDSLIGCGLLPGFEVDQIALVGNSSLAGAYASLLDSSFLDELRRLATRIEIVELNLEPDFESIYIDELVAP
ncbi:ASKHA domain-containing protein [Luteitalea sp.]|uniref:ASKHA domain-containing protein n=1 Tax=Luteitalea sp. TaxID=2004800 RepID=UPI000B2F8BA6|nr:ASKHA domain-containing protein [Luteitalea sp.]